VQGILDAGLGLLHLGFGAGADRNHRHAAAKFRQTFLELLAVVVAVGRFDLLAELIDAPADRVLLAGAFDDRGMLAFHGDLRARPN